MLQKIKVGKVGNTNSVSILQTSKPTTVRALFYSEQEHTVSNTAAVLVGTRVLQYTTGLHIWRRSGATGNFFLNPPLSIREACGARQRQLPPKVVYVLQKPQFLVNYWARQLVTQEKNMSAPPRGNMYRVTQIKIWYFKLLCL